MRILQVNSARTLGGGETHVLELVQTLRERGHDVVLAGRRNVRLKTDISLPFLNSADLFTANRLRSILKKQQFDIVHVHVARDYSIVAAACWGMPTPKVVFTRHLLYPVQPHFLYDRVDAWISPTEQIQKTLTSLKPKRSVVIPNWVDLKKFPYRPHKFHEPVVIGLAGQISPHKGHDDAVEAMRLLGPGFRLVIAGTGKTDYQERLNRNAEGLPIEFVGFVSMVNFFETVDIVIVPSWEEPFGLVLLEAMASGIPVIATDRGGPPEFVRGVLIPPRDPNSLASAIRSIRPADLVAEAREHVEKNFDMRRVVAKVEELYTNL